MPSQAGPGKRGRRSARGLAPRMYARRTAVLGIRLPEEWRRLVDHVALKTGTTPTEVGRLAVERLLVEGGFQLTAVPDDEARAKLLAWLHLTDLDQGRGAESPGATGDPPGH